MIDVDPKELAESGVTVTFSEPAIVKSGNVYFQIRYELISWLVTQSDDKTSITLTHKGTADLPYASEIVLKIDRVADWAGNETDLQISFTTRAKE